MSKEMNFHEALDKEDLVRIDKCIQKGLTINQTYRYSRCYSLQYIFTPLVCAVENQSVKVVEYLLKRGAVALIKSDKGELLLSLAARKGNLEIFKQLIKNGAEPSMQNALLVAIENRRLEMVKHMVEKGVFVNWKYKNGDIPLSKSITCKCEEIAIFLIDNGANIKELDAYHRTPLLLSIQNQTLDVLKYLIQKGTISIRQIDNSTMQKALLDGISNRNLDFVKYLVKKGASFNWNYSYRSETPLSKSITTDNCEEIAKFLIDNGANLEEYDSPLILSVENQKFDIMIYLLQKGANVNYIRKRLYEDETALSIAATKKYFLFATHLIKFGANINLAQRAVDKYAREDEDFDTYLKLFKMGQLKLNNSAEKKSSVLEKELGSGHEEASSLPK